MDSAPLTVNYFQILHRQSENDTNPLNQPHWTTGTAWMPHDLKDSNSTGYQTDDDSQPHRWVEFVTAANYSGKNYARHDLTLVYLFPLKKVATMAAMVA